MTDTNTKEALATDLDVWFLTECCDRLIHYTARYCPCCGWECRVKPVEGHR